MKTAMTETSRSAQYAKHGDQMFRLLVEIRYNDSGRSQIDSVMKAAIDRVLADIEVGTMMDEVAK